MDGLVTLELEFWVIKTDGTKEKAAVLRLNKVEFGFIAPIDNMNLTIAIDAYNDEYTAVYINENEEKAKLAATSVYQLIYEKELNKLRNPKTKLAMVSSNVQESSNNVLQEHLLDGAPRPSRRAWSRGYRDLAAPEPSRLRRETRSPPSRSTLASSGAPSSAGRSED